MGTAGLKKPADGQNLNYIHVLFEWDQEPDARYYQLEIDSTLNFSFPISIDSIFTTLFIDTGNIAWGNNYSWRVRSIRKDNSIGNWTESFSFSTLFEIMNDLTVIHYQNNSIQEGFTAFSGPSPWQTVIIDINGKEIWNDGGNYFKLNHIDQSGSMYGSNTSGNQSPFSYNTGSKVNVDMEYLWYSEIILDPHDLKQLPNGNYLAFINVDTLGVIPSNNGMTQAYRNLGFLADGTTAEFPWFGQKIVELTEDNEIVWSWNPFDHFTMEDFDNHGFTWFDAFLNFEYDWMHANAIHFDEDESAIYLSVRHLSRITKIDYPSGDVIWNMGLPEPYISTGSESICSDLLFSFQHHVQKLDNGNLIFFDNGNISDQLFGYDERISRVLEIKVIEDSICTGMWEYFLPSHLHGTSGGSVQVLENGNRLIYTYGNDGGIAEPTILEVTEDQELVWEVRGGVYYSWYRAFRIPSLHPDAFTVIANDYQSIMFGGESSSCLVIDEGQNLVFNITNESGYNQLFVYEVNDKQGWFESTTDTVNIDPGDSLMLALTLTSLPNDSMTTLQLNVWPVYHPYAQKSLDYNVYSQGLLNTVKPPIPLEFILYQNHPNPFNPITTLHYDLPEDALVTITIYDMMGRIIRNLINTQQSVGYKSIQWNATNNAGQPVSAGLYIYTIRAGKFRQTKKMVLLK